MEAYWLLCAAAERKNWPRAPALLSLPSGWSFIRFLYFLLQVSWYEWISYYKTISMELWRNSVSCSDRAVGCVNCLWLHAEDPTNIKPVRIPVWMGRGLWDLNPKWGVTGTRGLLGEGECQLLQGYSPDRLPMLQWLSMCRYWQH